MTNMKYCKTGTTLIVLKSGSQVIHQLNFIGSNLKYVDSGNSIIKSEPILESSYQYFILIIAYMIH